MNNIGWTYALATLAGAAGLWLMLPRGRGLGRGMGMVLGALALSLIGWRLPQVGGWLMHSQFLVIAGVTVASSAAAMTFRNPVYCAVWFGLSLLGTAALLLWQGSQFLAVATIVVYAGAILVTLLFVLMLANPRGASAYDRTSWESPLAATIGAVLVGVLLITLFKTLELRGSGGLHEAHHIGPVMHDEHVAILGAEVFSRYLIAVEIAGTLLLVALVGAVAIVAHSRLGPGDVSTRPATAEGDVRHG